MVIETDFMQLKLFRLDYIRYFKICVSFILYHIADLDIHHTNLLKNGFLLNLNFYFKKKLYLDDSFSRGIK